MDQTAIFDLHSTSVQADTLIQVNREADTNLINCIQFIFLFGFQKTKSFSTLNKVKQWLLGSVEGVRETMQNCGNTDNVDCGLNKVLIF